MSLESARFPYNFPKDEDHSQKCSGTSRSARIATATIVKQIQFPSTHSPCSIKMALANQYLRRIVLRARGQSFSGRIRAVAAKSGPFILPRMVQGAIRTCGLFLRRLYFPESLRVITYSLPFSSPNQTGVRTTEPSFLKVPREMYF